MLRRFAPVFAFIFASVALAEQPKPETKTPVMSSDSEYELHGCFGNDDDALVSLRKKGESTSTWHMLGKNRDGIFVQKIDTKNGIVKIEINKAEFTLRLMGEAPPLSVDERVVAIAFKSKYYARLSELWESGVSEKSVAIELQAKKEAVRAHPEWDNGSGLPDANNLPANEYYSKRYMEIMKINADNGDSALQEYMHLEKVKDAAESKTMNEMRAEQSLTSQASNAAIDLVELAARTYAETDRVLEQKAKAK